MWGVLNHKNKWEWRLNIKPKRSFRTGLHEVSYLPRFDAKLFDKGGYVNPFTGARGTYKQMSHIKLENNFMK